MSRGQFGLWILVLLLVAAAAESSSDTCSATVPAALVQSIQSAVTTNPMLVNFDALKSEIRAALISRKQNSCPVAARLAWHASGTWDSATNTGGSNGGTIRFEPESLDPANAGLGIIRDLLLPVKLNHPEISFADIYAVAGALAIEFVGGPHVPVRLGRSDEVDGRRCPMHGRLPDAAQGAAHLRQVFGARMGFSDRDIVALSGAHTLGATHSVRSGFHGPWTSNVFRFDNEYFRNLLLLDWVPKKWDGPFQYEDVQTGKFMMLPTDFALKTDPEFRVWVELYAANQSAFFADFSSAYSRLLALGCPAHVEPDFVDPVSSEEDFAAQFRHLAMFGSITEAQQLALKCDVHAAEAHSGRTALHKSSFWGHTEMAQYLIGTLKLNVHATDVLGDTPLHDAAKFGHNSIVSLLLAAGASPTAANLVGETPLSLAAKFDKPQTVSLLSGCSSA